MLFREGNPGLLRQAGPRTTAPADAIIWDLTRRRRSFFERRSDLGEQNQAVWERVPKRRHLSTRQFRSHIIMLPSSPMACHSGRPMSPVVSIAIKDAMAVRARLTRLLSVPSAQPQICAASS